MKISLLDPGLKSMRGHHFDLDLRLVEALTRRGHEVEVHGFINPDPELVEKSQTVDMTLHRTFRVQTYASLPKKEPAIDAYEKMAQATTEDLARVGSTDMWFWPTLAPYQLSAAVSQTRSVRQAGGIWWQPDSDFPHQVGGRNWTRTIQKIMQTGHPFIIGAYDELLVQELRNISPKLNNIALLPCPHDGVRNKHQPTSLRRIGFFGHQRPSRGLDLMPDLIAALLGRGYEIVFQDSNNSTCRHYQNPKPGFLQFLSHSLNFLPNLITGRFHPRHKSAIQCGNAPIFQHSQNTRLEILPFVKDFAAEIARCDLVIWPAQREHYTQQYSGVVSECIATGVPVIAPSDCMPAAVLARYGCGSFFQEFTVDSIMKAVDEAARKFPDLKARVAADAWHQTNGTDHLAAWIETQTQGLK